MHATLLTEAMVKTAEQKARDRYRVLLLAGKTPRTYTEANRRILEEERAKIAAGGADVREAPLIQAVAAQEAPLIPAEAVAAQPLILAVSQEALGFEPEQAEPEAVAPPLGSEPEQAEPEAVALPLGFEPEQAEPESPPQSLCPPMPVVPAVPAAPEALALRPRKQPSDSDLKPDPRKNAPANFKRARREDAEYTTDYAAYAAELERQTREDAERRKRQEDEQRALVRAAEAADQAAARRQRERREQEMAERRARILQQMDSECRSCKGCFDMDYQLGRCVDQMCSKHRQRHSELVLRQSGAATTGAVSLA